MHMSMTGPAMLCACCVPNGLALERTPKPSAILGDPKGCPPKQEASKGPAGVVADWWLPSLKCRRLPLVWHPSLSLRLGRSSWSAEGAVRNWPTPAEGLALSLPRRSPCSPGSLGRSLGRARTWGLRAWCGPSAGHAGGLSGGVCSVPVLGEPLGSGTSRNGLPWRSPA